MIGKSESDFSWASIKYQIYAAFVANLVLVGHGSIAGWLSPALSVLLSDETPLDTGIITNEEISWLGSISSLGSIVGTFIFGGLSSLFGCKRAMIYLGLPTITFWILIHFGDTISHLLFARFSMGLTAGGVQSGIILYVSEISNDNIRGRLGSLTPLARNIGVLVAYIIGATVDYDVIPAIFIYIPILYMICLYFLPNTPQYHLRVENIKEAEKSFMYYKGYEGKTIDETQALHIEFERLKAVTKESNVSDRINLRDFHSKTALKGLIIGIAMAWFLQMTGCFIIINYATLVFQRSNTKLDPHISSIVLAIVQIFGGLISTSLSDAFGRKIIVIISLFGSALGLFCLSLYSYLSEIGFDLSNYSSLPIVYFSFVIFISSAGIAPLSNVCAVENLPPEVRTAGMVFYTLWYNIVSFLGDKYFPILLQVIHLHGCMLIFAINCCLGTFFVIFCMKETKGRSLNFRDSTINHIGNS